jgi:phosphoenolpyruvate carboxylase
VPRSRTLICQVEIYGFVLAQLDLRPGKLSPFRCFDEITAYLQVLPQPYNELSEAEKTAWLIQELQTRRPLVPAELPFSERTVCETIETFRMVRRLHQEFGPQILPQLHHQHEPHRQRPAGGAAVGQGSRALRPGHLAIEYSAGTAV